MNKNIPCTVYYSSKSKQQNGKIISDIVKVIKKKSTKAERAESRLLHAILGKCNERFYTGFYTGEKNIDINENLLKTEPAKWGLFNGSSGKIVVPPIYEYIGDSKYEELLIFVKQDAKFGFINHKGEIVVPLIYDYAEGFNEGRAIVKQNGKCGYIDGEGKIVVPLIYDNVYRFYNDRAVVKNG